jgi:predicted phosphate transport protein (TIGR00153 family)
MRIPIFSKFMELPFDGIQEHAEKVKECAWAFQQAIECYFSDKCERFEEYLGEIDRLESEADHIKRNVRVSISKRAKMTLDKFNLFMYIGEQDKVLDCVEECLGWISYRPRPVLPEEIKGDFVNLVDAVIAPIEELSLMVVEARKYFDTYSERQRNIVIDIIHNMRKNEHESDKLEDDLKLKIFTKITDPIVVYHKVELVGRIGAIADHAENTGDLMRAMIEEK